MFEVECLHAGNDAGAPFATLRPPSSVVGAPVHVATEHHSNTDAYVPLCVFFGFGGELLDGGLVRLAVAEGRCNVFGAL